MAKLRLDGTITDTQAPSQPVSGMTVNVTGAVSDSTTTNSSGLYVFEFSAPGTPGSYTVNPTAKSPHWADPGVGTTREWDGTSDQSHTENFTSTFSNNAPTRTAVSNQSYEEDSGTKFIDCFYNDTDGDTVTPVKVSGPGWVSLSKISNTKGRFTVDTAPAPTGGHTVTWRADDPYTSSSNDSFTITITSAPTNTAPTVDAGPDVILGAFSGTHAFQVTATDPDGDRVEFLKDSGPAGVTVVTIDDVARIGEYRVNTNILSTEGDYVLTVKGRDPTEISLFDVDSVTITIVSSAWPFMGRVGG